MTKWLSIFLHAFVSLFRTRRDLAFENLLLRQPGRPEPGIQCSGGGSPSDSGLAGDNYTAASALYLFYIAGSAESERSIDDAKVMPSQPAKKTADF